MTTFFACLYVSLILPFCPQLATLLYHPDVLGIDPAWPGEGSTPLARYPFRRDLCRRPEGSPSLAAGVDPEWGHLVGSEWHELLEPDCVLPWSQ